MKNKLSALKFVLNNKKQVFVLMLTLSLSFMTMYVINFMLQSTIESFNMASYERSKTKMFVFLSDETLGIDEKNYSSNDEYREALKIKREEAVNKIKKYPHVKNAFYSQVAFSNYDGIVGNFSVRFPLIEKEDIKKYIEDVNASIIDGRLPENAGEIALDKRLFMNQRLNLGDDLDSDIWGDTFKVVGILDSENMDSVGIPNGHTNSGNNISIIFDKEYSSGKEIFEELGYEITEYDVVVDKDTCKKYIDDIVDKQIGGALIGIMIVIIIFLAISILVAYISFLRNRINEYCLYISIGYSRSDIYKMIMKEIGIIFGVSICVGIIFTGIMLIVLDNIVIAPLGLFGKYIYIEHLFRIIAAFFAIIGVLQIPIIITINGIKTIDMIED